MPLKQKSSGAHRPVDNIRYPLLHGSECSSHGWLRFGAYRHPCSLLEISVCTIVHWLRSHDADANIQDRIKLFRHDPANTQHPTVRYQTSTAVTSGVLGPDAAGLRQCETGRPITYIQLDRLQYVLNAAARLVYSSRKYDYITELLRELHLLRVPERTDFRLAVIVYRYLQL